jgi:methane/ammonia monooxygenase subunit C
MAQMPALIPKEVEIQRLKKIYIMVIMLGSIAASVEVDNFVDGSLHQTAIRDSAFTPAHWWLYSHFIALPLGWGFVAMYDRRVPILRGPNNSMNTGLKITIIGYLATMFTMYK